MVIRYSLNASVSELRFPAARQIKWREVILKITIPSERSINKKGLIPSGRRL
jgi:hypothetical protein